MPKALETEKLARTSGRLVFGLLCQSHVPSSFPLHSFVCLAWAWEKLASARRVYGLSLVILPEPQFTISHSTRQARRRRDFISISEDLRPVLCMQALLQLAALSQSLDLYSSLSLLLFGVCKVGGCHAVRTVRPYSVPQLNKLVRILMVWTMAQTGNTVGSVRYCASKMSPVHLSHIPFSPGVPGYCVTPSTGL
ncbi:hypothetical protein RRG08_034986 [Elysia crispata]|uniref:Uncharacterized protein n=1 Tax=Elysia crispata TaxID=231223 RepID=A0AAE0Y314_9GAST|nr:hypothetical protein RRG08_034986 [Elysia crispata]